MSVQELRGGGGYRGMEGTSTTNSNATLNTNFSVNIGPHEVAVNSYSPNVKQKSTPTRNNATDTTIKN